MRTNMKMNPTTRSAIINLVQLLSILLCVSCQQKEKPDAKLEPNHRYHVDDLPTSHYQFYLRNRPSTYEKFKQICSKIPKPLNVKSLDFFRAEHANLTFEDSNYLNNLSHGKVILNHICSMIGIIPKSCWGYETSCDDIYLQPECKNQDDKIQWFNQADFGYVLERRKEMNRFCIPDRYSNDSFRSSLECTKYFRTCKGQDLMLKFGHLPRDKKLTTNPVKLFKNGDVGGWNCDLQVKRIPEEKGHNGSLQSWFPELSGYQKLHTDPSSSCDIVIEKPAYLIKLDSTTNMYHYFCNFINLYATMHLNNRFTTDNQIIIWDNQQPVGTFEETWKAFSKNRLISINEFEGKRVCFKQFVFTLLPRMVDGLYYSTPLVAGCTKTGLFKAFNEHLLYKLKINQEYEIDRHKSTKNEEIRITFISRSTHYRQIINEQEIVNATRAKSDKFNITLIDFASLSFLKQVEIVQNTDLLVGIHGAGLTHLLFLPHWAGVLELETCGDKCYSDLARLRGVSHFTPLKASAKEKFAKKIKVEDSYLRKMKLVDHAKFSNYDVNVDEYLKMLDKAVKQIKQNRLKYFASIDKTRDEGSSKEIKVQSESNKREEL